MNILAVDTATELLSAALLTKNGSWYIEINAGTRHSELLMDSVESLFKLASIAPSDLNLIACMKGPGSFTGLRIGFSTAKGLSMALGIPLLSIPTLDCMAHSVSFLPGLIIPLIDAKKNCFFSALYRKNTRLTDYYDINIEDLLCKIEKERLSKEEPIILTGTGAKIFLSRLPPEYDKKNLITSPESSRGRAWELLEMVKSTRIDSVEGNDNNPIYLRKSDAELNKA